jgi:hypothetical protein
MRPAVASCLTSPASSILLCDQVYPIFPPLVGLPSRASYEVVKLRCEMVFAFETASNGGHRNDWPAWPAVYSSFISISFLLLSSVRLWQLRLSSVKIKPIRNSHIKVVCLETENGRILEDIDSSSGHYIGLPGIATEHSHQILS